MEPPAPNAAASGRKTLDELAGQAGTLGMLAQRARSTLATHARPLSLLPLGRSRYAGQAALPIRLWSRREGYPIGR
jgi:hypothetical protein